MCSEATVSKLVREYEKEHNTILPSRSSIHDLGQKISHKVFICKKSVIDKKSTSEIAKLSSHANESVDRYLNAYQRVAFCYQRNMSPEDIAFSTKLSVSLVNEYIKIYNSLAKKDENA